MSTRTIQPDDLFGLKFLNGARLSPDGKQVVYYVNQINAELDKEFATIHLLNRESGEDRALTNWESRDTKPQWSHDGKSIAFISTRKGKPQLFIMAVDGGEARQMTDLKQGISGFAWSPDGNKIAFTAGPDFEDDAPLDLTTEPYRVTRTIYRFDAIGYLDYKVNNLYVLDMPSHDVKQITDDDTNNTNPRWSPDGSKILYDATMQPDTVRGLAPRLILTDLDGNQEMILNDWQDTVKASFTPDGKKIVLMGIPQDYHPIGSKSDLFVYDLASGTVENRSAGIEVGVGGQLSADMPTPELRTSNVLISADSQSAYVTVQAGGNVNICKIALSGEEQCTPITSGDCESALLDLTDNGLLYSRTTINEPPEIWYTDLATDTSHQLTNLNTDYLASIAQPESEHLLFEGVDGVQVEGWYLKPPVGEAPYPTILYIHGGPHAAYGNGFHFDFQMLAGAGYGVLFVNHRASTGYGDSFSTAIKGDWGNLDYNDLMSGVDYAIAQGLADVDHMGVCGTSGGGNLSCWIVGHTDRFKAAIPQNPVSNWRSFYGTSDIGIWFAVEQLGGHPHEIPEVYEKCSPITYAHNCTTPTLLVQSEHDWRCPAEQAEQFYSVLKANGCIVEMVRQPGGSHGASINGAVNLRRAHNDAMLDWFARYV